MGGGAMRTAAKAAAIGGYRSVGASSSLAAAAGGRTLRSPAATVSTVGLGVEAPRPISVASSDKGLQDAIQRPSWDFEEWEFAESVETAGARDPQYQAPRIVFGQVPTVVEAWEATSDLKDALNAVYPSRVCSAEEAADESTHRVSPAIISSMPGYVSQTFSLLQDNPEVQNVVASIAADKNVWSAVMKNEKVVEFYRTHTSILPLESDATSEDVPAAAKAEAEAEAEDDSTNAEAAAEKFTFADFSHNVKEKVMEVVNGLSDLIQDFFNTRSSNNKSNDEADSAFAGKHLGETLMALALATILVVLFKRG